MKKFYFLILFFTISTIVFSQDSTALKAKEKSTTLTAEIEGFKMFPNPITNGKLNITTLENGVKSVEIFDILGKRVFSRDIIDPQVNLSSLKSGVYILKVTENNRTATRKLVIK